MSGLEVHVDDYLRLRRALGYRLEREERWLHQLIAYVQGAGSQTLTSELAISWARLPATAQRRHWAQRLGCARKFATYLHTIDPSTQIPPTGLFPAERHRPTPYLWTVEQIEVLLETARALRPPLRGLTYWGLFGLLAVSGMRLGEAVGLHRGDVDLDTAVITIRHAKFDRPRIVPLRRPPPRRCACTRLGATNCARSRVLTRSSCPPAAPPWIEVRSTRRCAKSLPRWESAPPRSIRAPMISDTVLLFTPSSAGCAKTSSSMSTSACSRPTSVMSARPGPTGI